MEIHTTSIISEQAKLGTNIRIGPYAVIEANTEIDADNEIRAHAVIKRFSSLGRSNVVHEGAIIGGEPQDLDFVDCESYVRVGNQNLIREHATIHRGTQPGSATRIGSNCFVMACAHIAHNCRIGDRVIMANNVALAGHVEIEDQAFLSGGVVVHQFCRIGRLAMIGGNSKIVQDCLPFTITDGVPGRASGLNLIGLRRAGFAVEEIKSLKEAYRILLRSGLRLEAAIDRLMEIESEAVSYLIDFVRNSKRGFCHT